MLDSSEHYYNAAHNFNEHGIELSSLRPNLKQMMARKNNVVQQTVEGINYLMKKNKIDVHHGLATFISNTQVKVTAGDGNIQQFSASNFIVATGSKPASPPAINIDKQRIITSTEALQLSEIPGKLIVIGGGVIGLELGSVYARLGTRVQVVEFLDALIPTMDRSLSKELEKNLKKLGFEFFLKHKVTDVKHENNKVTVVAHNQKDEPVELSGDYCLVSTGRKPYTEGLDLKAAGVEINERGFINVDEHCRTNAPNIYAIGDVIRGAMLAHKAEEEGIFVAETIAGQKPHINYLLIPGVVYTWPEVAGVGYTEEQLKENLLAVYNSIEKNKPTGVKGRYFKSFNICTTMSPSIMVELGSFKKL